MPLVYEDDGFDYAPAERQEPLAFLESYGYLPADMASWRPGEGGRPKLTIEILRHLEVHGNKWYVVRCSLTPRVEQPMDDQATNCQDLEGGGGAPPRRAVEWRVKRRMRHLREGLHDPVKAICGRAYMQLFQGAHFAFHTSWPGTTDRLNAWLGLLASSIDSGAVAPSVAALALHFLEPPSPGEEAPDPGETDYSELARLQEAARGADPADVAARMAAMSLRSEDKQKYSRWYWWLMPVPG
eukprot:CAMPEP_0204577674 /NCGR_PEP_ID=MMETSP0661-20131031/42480_1 /ASSEMBLY_ACC=CAM_ASM_000606 /TAXON_ID=109239 /ORGANISM="Alexandrium margalefi, Strain AMGDE01CS-322" /LENGTH=240 /DNA_ID=CAMNT_0051586531 /DNA_START=60 /DNA_END=782 /DNA_ORIENTATION=+